MINMDRNVKNAKSRSAIDFCRRNTEIGSMDKTRMRGKEKVKVEGRKNAMAKRIMRHRKELIVKYRPASVKSM